MDFKVDISTTLDEQYTQQSTSTVDLYSV